MKFKSVKTKILLFLSILTLLGTIFCIVSCDNFLSQNSAKTTINLNLDLSKLIKNARNDNSQTNEYILKVFVYDAQNYQEGDKEIEKLPLVTQSSNKVDVNGTVKASLEVTIDSTVIFVGKLFTLNDDNTESEKPLYAGKSEVIKIQPKDNKVHLVLSREKAEIGFEIELAETHEHTFNDEWSTNNSHHWKSATCEHSETVTGFEQHTFSDWEVKQEPTEEVEGSKERICSVCNYKDTVEITKLTHTHSFSDEWTSDMIFHWKSATCEHSETVTGFEQHTFSDWEVKQEPTEEVEGSKERICSVCNYKDTVEIAKLTHTHSFSDEWTTNETHHWKWSTCEHDVVSEKAEHTFADWATINQPNIGVNGTKERYCQVCNYKETDVIAKIPENFVLIPAGAFQMGSNAGEEYEKPVHEVTLTKDYYIGKYEITQAEYEKYYSFVENSITSDYGDGDEYPAYFVNWFDTLVYCNKRSISENLMPCYSIKGTTDPNEWGEVPDSNEHQNYATWLTVTCDFQANGYRLPTEAEWEYAARAGDDTTDRLTYSGTSDVNELGDYAWYKDNSYNTTHEVGMKKANAFGLYDMSGNVMEWCWDVYTDTYDEQDNVDPTGASSGEFRVHRGSSWNNTEKWLAVSSRVERVPSGRWYDYGFRVVRSCSN